MARIDSVDRRKEAHHDDRCARILVRIWRVLLFKSNHSRFNFEFFLGFTRNFPIRTIRILCDYAPPSIRIRWYVWKIRRRFWTSSNAESISRLRKKMGIFIIWPNNAATWLSSTKVYNRKERPRNHNLGMLGKTCHMLFARNSTFVRPFNHAISMQRGFIRRTYEKYFKSGFSTLRKIPRCKPRSTFGPDKFSPLGKRIHAEMM